MKQARKAGFDVVTVGAATRDLFVRSKRIERVPSDSAPDGFNACLPMGAKIPVEELIFETGGGATNAAVTFAHFGLKTSCISRVGADPGGKAIVAHLKNDGVDVSGIETDAKERTAYSIILLASSGNRTILVARGASQHVGKNKIDWKKLRSDWMYLTSVGNEPKFLTTIFTQARKECIHIAWNPGNAEIELGLKKLLPHFLQTDVLILNREEAAALSDCSPRDLRCLLRTLGPLPRLALVITDGRHGAYVHARGTTWHAGALAGKILNTTGAGDAFGSAFTASLITDGDIETALKTGTLNAFGVVSHMGAKAGILHHKPTSKDLRRVKVRAVS